MTTPDTKQLVDWLRDSRRRTLAWIDDLDDAQLLGPRLSVVNPLLWEIGHVAWFQEKWVLRHARRRPPLRADGDGLYNSAEVPHDTRWDLRLPSRTDTLAYMRRVHEDILQGLDHREPAPDERYFILLGIFHEDMHAEAFAMTRQILAYPRPRPEGTLADAWWERGPLPGDVVVPGGTFSLGAHPDEGFVFDNEKWAHTVTLEPFAIARAPVTQAEFAVFVEDDGYRRPELWSAEGWHWRQEQEAEHPLYWRRQGTDPWQRRDFDRWLPLEPHHPMVHANWYEAEAYCRWKGRRLPAEAEWEAAAEAAPRRRYPWGDEPPSAGYANLDALSMGGVDVSACEAGESRYGCRQMLGNVWEWTKSDFLPYPGFVIDPYKEYSAPWFGTHKVLRGGSWATRGRLLRTTWRNFYRPERRDAYAGFRTCALQR
jgi:gamma-glutamyl hercynylcysteine S-oxide synthase